MDKPTTITCLFLAITIVTLSWAINYNYDLHEIRLQMVEYNSVLNTEQISACCSAMDSHAGDSSQHILFVEVLK